MANNPNVNKVVYGDQTVMDITDTTAEPETVLEGEVFYDKSGTRQTGSAVIPDISNCYQTTDTVDSSLVLDDADYIPVYDYSASTKKNTVWSNIKAKLKAYFDTVYATLDSPAFTGTPTAPTAASGTNTTQIATTAFVQTAINGHKYPYLLIRKGVTASAGSDVRIPASGYDSKIYPGLQEVYIPVAYSDTPIKFSQVKVHSGYLNITMAQAVTNIDMGVMIIT